MQEWLFVFKRTEHGGMEGRGVKYKIDFFIGSIYVDGQISVVIKWAMFHGGVIDTFFNFVYLCLPF